MEGTNWVIRERTPERNPWILQKGLDLILHAIGFILFLFSALGFKIHYKDTGRSCARPEKVARSALVPTCLLVHGFSLSPHFLGQWIPWNFRNKDNQKDCLRVSSIPRDMPGLISWYPQDVLKMRNAQDYYLSNVIYKCAHVPIMDVCVANLFNRVWPVGWF